MKYYFFAIFMLMGFSQNQGFAMDLVGNKDFALRLARIYLVEIYGDKNVEKQEPFLIDDLKEKWRVSGVLKPNYLGGVAEIEIRKKDGAVLRVYHGK